MIKIDISELNARFPTFRLALLVADGIKISLPRPLQIDEIVSTAEAAAWERWGDAPASEIPQLKAGREA